MYIWSLIIMSRSVTWIGCTWGRKPMPWGNSWVKVWRTVQRFRQIGQALVARRPLVGVLYPMAVGGPPYVFDAQTHGQMRL